MHPRKPLRRRLASSAPAVPLVLLVLAGCSGGGSGKAGGPGSTAAADHIGTQLEGELTQRNDVAGAQVRYVDDLMNPASATVDITMATGANAEALYQEGVRLVWQSRINPLTLIYVNVINPADPQAGISRTVYLGEPSERQPLEQKYGPHPG